MPSEVLVLGYTCVCGERVTLLEMTHAETTQLPSRITACCRNGHVSTFTAKQVGALDLWADRDDVTPPSTHAA